jgi:hypothetical protein
MRTLFDGGQDRDVAKKKPPEPAAAVGVVRWFNPAARSALVVWPAP